jgi:hypothetical protein
MSGRDYPEPYRGATGDEVVGIADAALDHHAGQFLLVRVHGSQIAPLRAGRFAAIDYQHVSFLCEQQGFVHHQIITGRTSRGDRRTCHTDSREQWTYPRIHERPIAQVRGKRLVKVGDSNPGGPRDKIRARPRKPEIDDVIHGDIRKRELAASVQMNICGLDDLRPVRHISLEHLRKLF